MNKFSMYSIILGVIGILSFITSGINAIQRGMEEYSVMQLTLFYVFFATGILCFILSFMLGLLGFRKNVGDKRLKYVGLLFVPIIVTTSVTFGLFIAWSAFGWLTFIDKEKRIKIYEAILGRLFLLPWKVSIE